MRPSFSGVTSKVWPCQTHWVWAKIETSSLIPGDTLKEAAKSPGAVGQHGIQLQGGEGWERRASSTSAAVFWSKTSSTAVFALISVRRFQIFIPHSSDRFWVRQGVRGAQQRKISRREQMKTFRLKQRKTSRWKRLTFKTGQWALKL